MPDLHIWTQNGETWACFEYDHGPFCRLCKRIDGIEVKPEHRRALLSILGYEVREGWGYGLELPPRTNTGNGWHVLPDDHMTTHASGDPALVLRDQRETTDG